MRNFYCLGLLMLLSMALCGGTVMAQEVTVDNIVYEIRDDSTAAVTKGDSATGDVVIPAEVEYQGIKYPGVHIGGKYLGIRIKSVQCFLEIAGQGHPLAC